MTGEKNNNGNVVPDNRPNSFLNADDLLSVEALQTTIRMLRGLYFDFESGKYIDGSGVDDFTTFNEIGAKIRNEPEETKTHFIGKLSDLIFVDGDNPVVMALSDGEYKTWDEMPEDQRKILQTNLRDYIDEAFGSGNRLGVDGGQTTERGEKDGPSDTMANIQDALELGSNYNTAEIEKWHADNDSFVRNYESGADGGAKKVSESLYVKKLSSLLSIYMRFQFAETSNGESMLSDGHRAEMLGTLHKIKNRKTKELEDSSNARINVIAESSQGLTTPIYALDKDENMFYFAQLVQDELRMIDEKGVGYTTPFEGTKDATINDTIKEIKDKTRSFISDLKSDRAEAKKREEAFNRMGLKKWGGLQSAIGTAFDPGKKRTIIGLDVKFADEFSASDPSDRAEIVQSVGLFMEHVKETIVMDENYRELSGDHKYMAELIRGLFEEYIYGLSDAKKEEFRSVLNVADDDIGMNGVPPLESLIDYFLATARKR